jgi:potassium-transporting ATPase KdpC subunit
MNALLPSLRFLALFTLLLGGLYPAFVWGVGAIFFPGKASGSLVRDLSGRPVGSALLAQRTDSPRYVSPRPSAGGYATVASGASQLPWTSQRLRHSVAQARDQGADPVFATSSGSGLDPHLPPETALAQLPRVAAARGWDAGRLAAAEAWIAAHAEGGTLGPVHVNVLRLNLALDALDPRER